MSSEKTALATGEVIKAFGNLLHIRFEGDVRQGEIAMVEIGDPRLQSAEMKNILLAKNRAAAGPTAPAHGLFFVRVDY